MSSKAKTVLASDSGDLFKDVTKPTEVTKVEVKPADDIGWQLLEKTKRDLSSSPEAPNGWIIVVEDSPAATTVLCGLLKKIGYGSIAFKDGAEALEFFKNSDVEQVNKLVGIYSDFEMPKLDGLGLLRELKQLDATRTIPFVIVTGNADRSVIQQAGQLGVTGFLLKPVTAEKVSAQTAKLKRVS